KEYHAASAAEVTMARPSAVQVALPVSPAFQPASPAPSTRGRSFVRLFVVLQTMQRSRVGLTLEQLARETGVTTRTIRRDLDVLLEAGVPLVDIAGDQDESGVRV